MLSGAGKQADTSQLGMGNPVSCGNLLYPILAQLVTTSVSSSILFLAEVPLVVQRPARELCAQQTARDLLSTLPQRDRNGIKLRKDLCVERFWHSCDGCTALGSSHLRNCFCRADTCEWVWETGTVCVSICLLEVGWLLLCCLSLALQLCGRAMAILLI